MEHPGERNITLAGACWRECSQTAGFGEGRSN